MVLLNKIKNKLRINYRKKRWPGLIEAYKQYLPVTKKTPIISLKEGNTPLILSESISNLIGNGTKVFLKYDGLNPTGSFKDRGMTMAISKAKEEGREAVICASTGNTSAAAAAYASRGGLKPYVLIPEGFVAQGKLAQALMYGAEIISINGNFDKALEIVRDLSSEHPIELVNSVNPYRIQGQKTAYEISPCLVGSEMCIRDRSLKDPVGFRPSYFKKTFVPFPIKLLIDSLRTVSYTHLTLPTSAIV